MQNFVIMRYFVPIFVLLSMVLIGCNRNNETTQTSSEARVNTFSFYEDTINPGLTLATYKIEHSSDTGRIYCVDSLRYGTSLDSVVPYITYKATPGSATYILPDTTIESTGLDTMDFNKRPIYLHVVPSNMDLDYDQWYRIDIFVHQADPDLYVWEKLTNQIWAPQNCETKAFFHNNQLLVLVNNGLATQLYTSANGETWSCITDNIPTLPTPCHVRDILLHNDTLYYIDDNSLFISSNGITWERKQNSSPYEWVNMLVSFDGKPWCLMQETSDNLVLATITSNGAVSIEQVAGLTNGILPAHFPISDFASLPFSSSSERPRAMIVGGRSINGEAVNTRWNLEYAANDGYRMKDFSIAQPNFSSLTGISIIQYNDQLYMFGGTDNDLTMRTDMLYSYDEGMNWYIPDSVHNQLPKDYCTRQNQTVVVDNNDNIYIIGGQSQTETLSDVYRGYLNSVRWE